MIYLSILITTLETRREQYKVLYEDLYKQIKDNNLEEEVEILSFEDNFDYPVGMKRNTLLQNAEGLFTVFIDDDDEVSDNYIITVINIIKNNPDIDCIGFKGLLMSEALGNKEFIHSIKYDNYSEDTNYYYRPPLHINPIRAEIAKRYEFPVINKGEDFDWAMKICRDRVLQKEAFVNEILYYYIFEWHKTAAQRLRYGRDY